MASQTITQECFEDYILYIQYLYGQYSSKVANAFKFDLPCKDKMFEKLVIFGGKLRFLQCYNQGSTILSDSLDISNCVEFKNVCGVIKYLLNSLDKELNICYTY